ncbi:MAG: YwqG family protein [Chloroflexota bacterium]
MFRDYLHLRDQIRYFNLTDREDRILQRARPALLMRKQAIDTGSPPIGSSKIGGDPDLSPDFEWRTHEQIPLTFVAQFKLSDLTTAMQTTLPRVLPTQRPLFDLSAIPTKADIHQPHLPEQGMLYFFYEASHLPYADTSGWQVTYHPSEDPADLIRISHPQGETDTHPVRPFPERPITFQKQLTIPRELYSPYETRPRFGNLAYTELWSAHRQRPHHTIYGDPYTIQEDVLQTCITQQAGIKPAGKRYTYTAEQQHHIESCRHEWQFLFQIGSDWDTHMSWGDMGFLYVCIPKISLAERRFEDCWVVIQSH